MLIGIDWGGTKIEGVALSPEGQELARIREDTPRHDYDGCIAMIRGIIDRLEATTGQRGSVGIGIPGSLEPKSRFGKGASSTWLLNRPVEADLHARLGRPLRVENDADCLAASEAVDGAGAGYNVVFAVILGSGAGAGIAVGGRAHHGPNNSAGEWGTIRCRCRMRRSFPASPATAASTDASRPGCRAAPSRRSTPATPAPS